MDTRNKQHRWLLHLLGAAILLLGLAACGSSEGPSEDEPNKPKPEAPVDDGDWQTVPATGGTIEKGDITQAGELLHTSWEYKKQFSSKITNPVINAMYDKAMEAGAIGGKVSGAGGGGFMFFICDYNSKYNVAKAIRRANEKAIVKDFMFEPHGVTSWRYPND